MRFLHTMVRVTDIDQSLDFYCNKLGLTEVRRKEVPQGRYTLVFLAAPGQEAGDGWGQRGRDGDGSWCRGGGRGPGRAGQAGEVLREDVRGGKYLQGPRALGIAPGGYEIRVQRQWQSGRWQLPFED